MLSTIIFAAVSLFSTTDASNVSSPTTFVCHQIEGKISNASSVYWPSTAGYENDIDHFALSSTQMAACSVEPGTLDDVGTILKIVGYTRTPFAVKSGGHAMNPKFSSTYGIQISMNRFNSTIYNSTSETARVGAGQIWDNVYAALEPFNVNVIGGRVPGIGVGGFTLGGGYSWLTNQYGLGLDNVLAYELVLPNGTITEVTVSSNSDLFFGLRGGFNNFGIVTAFTLKTFPQTKVWGGPVSYSGDKFEALQNATSNFATYNTDPKAAIISSFTSAGGILLGSLMFFYDAPTLPKGIFDEFLAINSSQSDVSTRTFGSLIQSFASNATNNLRWRYDTVSLTGYSKSLMNAIVNGTLASAAQQLSAPSDTPNALSYSVEPFTSDLFTHGSDSAYPPDRSRALFPLSISYAWTSEKSDPDFVDAIKVGSASIMAAADSEGQGIEDAALYGNYAVDGTPVSRIYGSNLPRLKAIRNRYDAEDVMSLAGGWKI